MINWLIVVLLIVWIYVLYTMKRAEMGVWYFLCGSVGLFVFGMIIFLSLLVESNGWNV